MLQLHVWGAAFGLPSIDAECLAAITYLHHALPSSEWQLIPGNNPAVSPSGQLPALDHEGVWTSGYALIVSYLTSKSLGQDLDASLGQTQKADSVAYSAYLAAHAGPLLDLSLYVSAANWSAATRPAYTALLPFPLTWTVPPLIRADAIRRVEHLGLAELDSDFDPSGGFHLSTGRDALPETFRRHIPAMAKKTVREEMTPEQATAIRLFDLVEDCMTSLSGFMEGDDGDKPRLRFFKDSEVCSMDCLAYGYLAIMHAAPVPRSFVKDWLEDKTPRLVNFVDSIASGLTARGSLPWAETEATTLLRAGGRLFDSMVRNIPSLGDQYATESRLRTERGSKGLDRRIVMLTLGFLIADLFTGFGVYTYRISQPFGARHQVWRSLRGGLNQFGEAGSMLSHAFGTLPAEPGGMGGNLSSGARFAATDTEVD